VAACFDIEVDNGVVDRDGSGGGAECDGVFEVDVGVVGVAVLATVDGGSVMDRIWRLGRSSWQVTG
jgi:hypothetical protein